MIVVSHKFYIFFRYGGSVGYETFEMNKFYEVVIAVMKYFLDDDAGGNHNLSVMRIL